MARAGLCADRCDEEGCAHGCAEGCANRCGQGRGLFLATGCGVFLVTYFASFVATCVLATCLMICFVLLETRGCGRDLFLAIGCGGLLTNALERGRPAAPLVAQRFQTRGAPCVPRDCRRGKSRPDALRDAERDTLLDMDMDMDSRRRNDRR